MVCLCLCAALFANVAISYLLWRKPSMLFEVTAEKADIGKMIVPSYFLYALTAAFKLHFELQNNILVDDVFGCVPRYLSHDVGEIF